MSGSVGGRARIGPHRDAYRANDWIYYDRLRLAANQVSPARPCARYWLWYGGVVTCGHAGRGDLWRGSRSADGIQSLNKQTGERTHSAVLRDGRSRLDSAGNSSISQVSGEWKEATDPHLSTSTHHSLLTTHLVPLTTHSVTV